MKHTKKFSLLAFFVFLIISCSPPIDLTTSWTNRQATVKKSPKIMIMAFGKNLANRQATENEIVSELKTLGYNAVAALDIMNPTIQHYDSLTLVNLLRENKFDMLLTNAVVDVKETERYIPGTTENVPVGSYPVASYPAYYGGFYNYYDYRMTHYQTVYETHTTPGSTVVDVEVLIESNLYDVATTQLLWLGQSKSLTADPSPELFRAFAKNVVTDMVANHVLQK
jgi:hypothetical protein